MDALNSSQLMSNRLGKLFNTFSGSAAKAPATGVKPVASSATGQAMPTETASTVVQISPEGQRLSSPPIQSGPVIDYTNTIKRPKDKTISALLAGDNHWWHTPGGDGSVPSAVAKTSLSFSFMSGATGQDGVGFAAMDANQKQSVRDALAYISTIVNVTFNEVGSGGEISYGTNNQSDSAGYARYPNDGGQVLLANNQSTFAGSWDPGSYTWQTLLHETAHALGLKHPGNYNAGGGGAEGPYLSKALDNRSNTIMSYNNDDKNMKRISYDGSSFSTTSVNPDSFQMFDVAALQYLYGEVSSVAKTFSFSEGDIFSSTIWNNNSSSVIDLSGMSSANLLDLRGGNFSSIGVRDPYADMSFTKEQYAALTSGGKPLTKLLGVPTYSGANNLGIAKGSQINQVVGGSGNDVVITSGMAGTSVNAGGGDDHVFLSLGTSGTVTGGTGDDTVYVQKGKKALWTLSGNTLTLTETKTGNVLSTVTLSGIEHVSYWSGKKAKATGKPILASPVQQQAVLAYGSGSESPASPKISETA